MNFHCTLTLPLPVTRARKSFPLDRFFTRMVLPVTPSVSRSSFEHQMRAAGGNLHLAPRLLWRPRERGRAGFEEPWSRRESALWGRYPPLHPDAAPDDRPGRTCRNFPGGPGPREPAHPPERSATATTRVVVVVMRARAEMPKRRLFP